MFPGLGNLGSLSVREVEDSCRLILTVRHYLSVVSRRRVRGDGGGEGGWMGNWMCNWDGGAGQIQADCLLTV